MRKPSLLSITGQKTVTVRKFSDIAGGQAQSGVQAQIEVKETGEKKQINGYNARELEMTMDMQMPQGPAAGMKMQMVMDMWLSSDVPGVQELREFYRRNANRFPWSAMGGGGNPAASGGDGRCGAGDGFNRVMRCCRLRR